MALTYNRQVRTLGIRGAITLNTGAQISIATEDVLYYSISESCGEDGLPLGTAEAASFELTISNVGKGYTPDMFDNAEVHMQIGIETDGAITYSDFGVWYVCDVNAPEQSVSIDLSGYDALATLFEVDYTDSEGAYPTSLASLASTICAAAGISLKSRSFVNADIQVSKMPEWGEGATLRSIIGFISACAGGFAHIDRSGLLEIVSYNSGSEYEVDPDLYSMLTRTNGTSFSFNALQVKFVDSEDDTYTRYALQSSVDDNPTNTIRVENNPLFTEGVANSVVTVLAVAYANPATVNWVGDPSVNLGDVLITTNKAGERLRLVINSQSFNFSGGFNAESACSLPALNTVNSSSYTSSGNIMDGNGNIKAERITNLDRTIVSATIGHFEKLDAESIKTDTLLAAIIDAVILKAQNISADSVDTDKLTSAIAEIVKATIRKLNAGTITTDELYASYAELFTLKTDSITADNILTDELAAALANITVLACGSATFDKATIQHLVAEAMNLEYGVAGQVFIKNLAVEYAQMVGATIGNLCIKASDGNYYTIDVDENGNVSATKTTVSSGEISAGQTSGGRVILETNITAANLNTSNLLATYALINRIDAARIDVAELFAQSAFVDALYTSKIYGGKSLEMIAGDVDTAVVTSDVEFYLSTSATVLAGGSWQTIAPEWVDGKYMWMRVKTRLIDGTESMSEPTCIAGATGKQGADGVSITAVTEQYYLSSSKTTQTGGQWQTTQPVWSEGKYIWTRIKIDYSDGSSSYTEPYCDATWEVANDAAIYTGDEPPEAPIAVGKLWIDTSVTPTVIRRWKGVTLDTLDALFTITNGSGTSGWVLSSNSGDGIDLVPGNIGVNSTTATVTLKAVRDLSSVVISGAYYTEAKYDKLTLTVAGTTVLDAVTGTSATAQRYAGALAKGDEIVLKYVKGPSQSAANEASTLFTIASGYWDTVSDLEEINDISNRLIAQQAEAQKAIDQLATAISIDTSGAHFYKPGYRDRSEVRIDQDSVDIVVGGNVNSSFIAGGLILGNYMLWHPEASGGLAFNLM